MAGDVLLEPTIYTARSRWRSCRACCGFFNRHNYPCERQEGIRVLKQDKMDKLEKLNIKNIIALCL